MSLQVRNAEEEPDALLAAAPTRSSPRRSPKHLNVSITPQSAYEFANGEIFVRFEESVRGCDAFVIQSHTAPINEWVMEQLIMVDALKRASAKRITVIMPFYPYARQDKKHSGREPISARLIADLFKTAGADRIMTVDLHTAQIQGFFDGPVDHLWAQTLLAEHVATSYGATPTSRSSPRTPAAPGWRRSGPTCSAAARSRSSTRRATRSSPTRSWPTASSARSSGRMCVVIDDMIDTGGTIVKAVEQLIDEGAAGVVVAATHGVLSGPASERLQSSGAREVVVTNTLPIPRGEAVRQADGAVDRPAAGAGDPAGLRGRLGDEPLRRQRLTCRRRSARSGHARHEHGRPIRFGRIGPLTLSWLPRRGYVLVAP